MLASEQGKLNVCTGLKTCPAVTHEQIKLVKENLRGKTCSLYTRASKATKELVKENLVGMCAGLNNSVYPYSALNFLKHKQEHVYL